MPFYKFMKKEHYYNFIYHGRLRIGTLSDYQKIDKYNKEIADKREGLYSKVHEFIGHHEFSDIPPELMKWTGIQAKGAPLTGSFNNVNFLEQTASQDLYIFSTSRTWNKEMLIEFGYNCCMEITNPEKFFKAICRKIRHKAKPFRHGEVVYEEKIYGYKGSPHHPAFIKDLEFQHQQEYRCAWEGNNVQLLPFFINVRDAAKYTLLVSLI